MKPRPYFGMVRSCFLGESVHGAASEKRHSGVTVTEDKASITLGSEDGSFGTIHYFANGAAAFPKERIEAFAAGRVLQIDNFRKMKGYGWAGFKKLNLWRQDIRPGRVCEGFSGGCRAGQAVPHSTGGNLRSGPGFH
jgi:predicted dehydrogenase